MGYKSWFQNEQKWFKSNPRENYNNICCSQGKSNSSQSEVPVMILLFWWQSWPIVYQNIQQIGLELLLRFWWKMSIKLYIWHSQNGEGFIFSLLFLNWIFRFIWPNCIKFIHETWVGNKLSLELLLQTTVWDLKVGIVVWGVGPPQGAFLTGPIVEAFKSCQIYLILVENRSQSAEVEEQRTSSLLHECNYCSIVNDKRGQKHHRHWNQIYFENEMTFGNAVN